MAETDPSLPNIERAGMEDFGELKGLLGKANEYSVNQSGRPGWTAMDHVHAGMQAHLAEGEYFVIRNSVGNITSTIVLSDTSSIWNEDQSGAALYFMKLMKDPAEAQPDEARKLLGFAAAEALRRHKTFLRCDTVADLQGLIDYYLRLGFENKGEFTYESSGRAGVFLEAESESLLKNLEDMDRGA